MKNSKSEGEGLQETHHSDSFSIKKLNSIYPENYTCIGDKDSKDGTARCKDQSRQSIIEGMKNTSDL